MDLKKRLTRIRDRVSGRVAAGVLLVVIGIGLILYPWITELRYALFQKQVATSRRAAPRKPAPSRKAPASQREVPDGAIANLVIPKISLDTYILEGTTQDVLSRGPGHYEETPLPDKGGNTAIAGHRTMYGHPFKDLDQLDKGDEIILTMGQVRFVYRVSENKSVSPKEVGVVAPTTDDRLTLTTCTPVGNASQRLVIVAKRVKN